MVHTLGSGEGYPMKSTTIRTLNDDVLLEIFDYYRLDVNNSWNVRLGWRKVSQVCRRWRHLIHSMAFHLGMRILCTNGTPTVAMLDHLSALPLFIDYRDTAGAKISQQDEFVILHAVLLRDRIRHINLHLPPSNFHKLLILLVEPYPKLEHLSLSCSLSSTTNADISLVLPKTFPAPNLRHLTLLGVNLPNRLRLLSSTTSIVTLVLGNIRSPGYFPPRLLVARLQLLPYLEELSVGFSVPIPRPSAERELLGKLGSPVTLIKLKFFTFQGVSAYLEHLIAQIWVPRLERLDAAFFNQIAFALPHLSHLINTTEVFKSPTVRVFFGKEVIISRGDKIMPRNGGPFTLRVICKQLDWQIDCAAQICSTLMPALSGTTQLKVDLDGQLKAKWTNGEIDGATWHELLRPFLGVNVLCICGALTQELSRALELDEVRLDPGLLPSMQEIVTEFSGVKLLSSFIRSRQVAGHPVRLR
jgi:hypothetical protein